MTAVPGEPNFADAMERLADALGVAMYGESKCARVKRRLRWKRRFRVLGLACGAVALAVLYVAILAMIIRA